MMRRIASVRWFVLLVGCVCTVQAQTPDPTQATVPERVVTWKTIGPNILTDQKDVWSFPARIPRRKIWFPTVAVLGVTAGLVAIDPIESSYFRKTTQFNGMNSVLSSTATEIGTIAVPASLYFWGLGHKDKKMEQTALLAGQAVADAEILTTVLKAATKRARPGDVPINGNFGDSWWDRSGPLWRTTGSFPSGHAIAAFSVATVISRQYHNHRWVPYAAYGLAALVGFSRLTLSAHFASDVFMGAALGYSISRFTVLQQ